MKLNFLSKIIDYCIYALAVLLAFLLMFEQYLFLPDFVAWFGHLHPVILHFPIVLIIITIIQYWRNDLYFSQYLSVTTFLTLLTAVTGLLLSEEGGEVKGGLILTHQWMGVTLAYLLSAWYWFFQNAKKIQIQIVQVCLVVAVLITGHLGGMVTHGEDFLTPNWMLSKPEITAADCSDVFGCLVQPVLNDKCVSCHNANKSKGELVLSDFVGLMKGGENGSVIDFNNLEKSALLQLIGFPLDHEYHMPPKEEKQLTDEEIEIINAWVVSGASDSLLTEDLEPDSELYVLAKSVLDKRQSQQWNDLPEFTDEEIASLSSDYCTIKRLYNRSNALQVLIYPGENVDERLQKLKPIAKNIIELDLKNLPLGEEEMQTVGSFENLEILNIGNSMIGNAQFSALGKMSNLKNLKIYNTQIGDESLDQILSWENISNIYIYNTLISETGLEKLQKEKPELVVFSSPQEALDFRSTLPSPKIVPDRVFFKKAFFIHPEILLDNIDVFYTTDGSKPNESAAKMADSISINSSQKLKYFAGKEGWENSPQDSVIFIKAAFSPNDYKLKNPPDKKYSGKGAELLFDLIKGKSDFSDSAWMAFRDEPLIVNCAFEDDITLNSIVLSSIVQTDQYLFPPASVKVYGGREENQLTLLGELRPSVPRERQEGHMVYFSVLFNKVTVKHLRVVVDPLPSLAIWHQGKGERAWFFIDELVISDEKISF